jgi:hypothetical protein
VPLVRSVVQLLLDVVAAQFLSVPRKIDIVDSNCFCSSGEGCRRGPCGVIAV